MTTLQNQVARRQTRRSKKMALERVKILGQSRSMEQQEDICPNKQQPKLVQEVIAEMHKPNQIIAITTTFTNNDAKTTLSITATHRKSLNALIDSDAPSKKLRVKAICAFSTLQHYFDLNFRTLILAVRIYDMTSNCQQIVTLDREGVVEQQKNYTESQMLSHTDHVVACANLAMKYEEIYPNRLNQMYKYFKKTFDPERYMSAELSILFKLDFNLNLIDASYRLLTKSEADMHFAHYLTELALTRLSISELTDLSFLVQAVQQLVYPPALLNPATEKLRKEIRFARIKAQSQLEYFFKKYSTEKCRFVACRAYL